VPDAVKVTTELAPLAGEKEAVTPAGRFDAANAALTVPDWETVVIVMLALCP
jgi:hypothetical protein